MKRLFFCFLISIIGPPAFAIHITGGEMSYTYANGVYSFTMKLFMRCNSGRTFNDPSIVSIFDKGTNARIMDINVPLASQEIIQLTNPNPCITNPPVVCYVEGYYYFTAILPPSANGYVISSQVNYRINGISNLTNGYSNIGATYTAEIPGTSVGATAYQNNSAVFVGSDLVIICAENFFTYSFAAEDPDGDELRYAFCEAYQSGTSGGGAVPTPPPPYSSVPYGNGFNSSSPLGPAVQIDSQTGIISGIAPASGIYVVTVCVSEIRNGVVIAIHRKDLQINIADCSIAAAILEPRYQLCRDSYTINLVNLSNSPLITAYHWVILNAAGSTVYTATTPTVTYTFADTGRYTVKLTINPGQACSDSTTSLAIVYPGFVPAFGSTGICFTKPTLFSDSTVSAYGTVNSWHWEFGESSVSGDTSTINNPSYTYPSMGSKLVQLTVGNSVGCQDTATRIINILDRPPLSLGFHDTLICRNDNVQLLAVGNGNFSWTPVVNIINPLTATPTVSPGSTTKYYVVLDDNGCLNRDSVLVRTTNQVDIAPMPDTTICSGDTIQLRIVSDGFRFSWSPASQLVDPLVAEPFAITNTDTRYSVIGRIGSCIGNSSILVKTVPYPIANAGNDTTICFNTTVSLHGVANGSSVTWLPSFYLNNDHILSPTAKLSSSIRYVLLAFDTKGCPKPGKDTILVTVLPRIVPYAGRDTSVVLGQPLQLMASGGSHYLWSPATGLSAVNINNPVAIYSESTGIVLYKVTVYNNAGCSDSAFVKVRIFAGGPTVYVPNAFSPNDDGINDVLHYIPAGIKQIEYFKIYNRPGELIFDSNDGKGWDGRYKGIPQDPGVFVWMVKAVDYNNKPYFSKGVVVLIR